MAKKGTRSTAATGVVVFVVTADAATGVVLQMNQQDPPDVASIRNLKPVISVDIALSATVGQQLTPQAPKTGGPQITARGGHRPLSTRSRQQPKKGRRGGGGAPEV